MAQHPSPKRLKKAAIFAAIVVLTLMTVIVLLYDHAAQRDFFFNEIKALVKEKTGYVLQKTGPLKFSLLPRPSLKANRLKISNPGPAGNPAIAEMNQLTMFLNWPPLLRLQLQIDVELDSPDINLEVDANGRENWMTEELLTATGGLPFELGRIDTWGLAFLFKNHQKNEILGFDLEQFDLDFTQGRASARIESAGRIGRSRFFAIGDAVYELGKKRLDVNLDFGAGEAADIKVGAIQAPSVTQWIRQNASLFPLQGGVKGAVAFDNRTPIGRLEISAALASLGDMHYLTDVLAPLRPDMGPVSVKGRLLLTGGDLDIDDLEARMEHEHAKLYVSGGVSNILSAVEADLKIKSEADALSVLANPAFEAAGPAGDVAKRLGPVKVSASITARDGEFIISDLDLGLAHNSFRARVGGKIQLLRKGIHLDIDHRSDAVDSADLFELFGLDHPQLADSGPFQFAAKIRGENGSYSIRDAAGELQDGNIKTTLDGQVSLADKALRFDLNSGVDVKEVSRLVALLPQALEPYLEGLTGTAKGRVSGNLADFSVSDFEVKLTRQTRSLDIWGDVSQLPGNPTPRVQFHFSTKTPVELEQYFSGLKSQELTGPLDLIGSVRKVDNEIHIDNLALQAKQIDVEGGVRIDLNTEPPRIYAIFDSRQFLTSLINQDPEVVEQKHDVGGENQGAAAPETEETLAVQDPSEAFKAFTSGIAIETDWIKNLNLYANFNAENTNIGDYHVENMVLTIDARGGVFTLAEFQVTIDQRPLTFRALIDTNFDPPAYAFSGEIEGDTLEAILALEDGIFVGGDLNGNFKLLSQGKTLGAIIENLDGEALIEMGPLGIMSNALTVFSSDIIHSILSGVTTKQDGQPTSSYDCAVLGVNIKNGVARSRRAFTMQARDYNLAGSGELDLNTGYIDYAVRPRARRGLGFSISTVVGGFRIRGHIATPEFGLSGGNFLTALITGYALAPTTAVLAANPATGTILATGFFIRGLVDRLTSGNFTCASTLRRIERSRARSGQTAHRNPHAPKWH